MSCSRARRELLEYFALGEELGPRSWPHLAHMESCAHCRWELGIDRELVANLRRALRERVDGHGPSEASWKLVRSRTVDRPVRSWRVGVVQWRGMVSAAAAAGVMLFAVSTAPPSRLLPAAQSLFVASVARRAVPPLEEAKGWPMELSSAYSAPQTYPPLPGWPMRTQKPGEAATLHRDLPIPAGMR